MSAPRPIDPSEHRISAVVWARLGLVLVDGILLLPRLIGAALGARRRREALRALLRAAAGPEPAPRATPARSGSPRPTPSDDDAQANPDQA